MLTFYKPKTDSDFEFIASLFCPDNCEFMLSKSMTSDAVKEVNASPRREDYILTVDDKKIGWFNIRQAVDINKGRFGMIINKPYQGKGYGKEAIKLIQAEAKKLGIKKLRLEVFEDNVRAINLYKKAGFKETGRLIAMEKEL